MCGVQPKPVDVRPLQDQVSRAAQQCPPEQVKALQQQCNDPSIQQAVALIAGAALFAAFKGAFDSQRNNVTAPECGCLRPPSQDQAAAPAGKGLSTNPEGWPQGSVRTAGGYTVVPEGKDAAWKIYGPQQGPQDKPLSRIWGDPHVDEADGQRWDFTKSSNFRLPDGTMIDVKTTSETGRSVSKSLNIVNGNDRVSIDGIDQNKPTLSNVSRDGFEYRARLQSENPNRDTFVLGGTGREADGNDRVQWARERGGQIEGVINGTIQNADGHNGYSQTLDKNKEFQVDSSLRPDPFKHAAAWHNMLRSEVADAAGRLLPADQRDAEIENLVNEDTLRRFRGAGGLDRVFKRNSLDEGLSAASFLFGMMFQQMELANTFGESFKANRGLFV
jgi:hypothetical protein